MTELLPCPFCGSAEVSAEGIIRYSGKHDAWWADGTRITLAFYCNCLHCGFDNKGLLAHQTKAKAIAAWNRRASPPAAQPRSEDARALLLEATTALMNAKATMRSEGFVRQYMMFGARSLIQISNIIDTALARIDAAIAAGEGGKT